MGFKMQQDHGLDTAATDRAAHCPCHRTLSTARLQFHHSIRASFPTKLEPNRHGTLHIFMYPARCLLIARRVVLTSLFVIGGPAFADVYDEVSQLIKANALEAALVKAEAHLSSKPADPQMRFLKGMVQRGQNKIDDALKTFTDITEDYPELPEPHNNLAVMHAAKGQFHQAQKALEMAIKAKPDYAAAYENLADVHVRLAEQAYRQATTLEPQNTRAVQKLRMAEQLLKPQSIASR